MYRVFRSGKYEERKSKKQSQKYPKLNKGLIKEIILGLKDIINGNIKEI